MYQFSDNFFARASLALQQDGTVSWCNHISLSEYIAKLLAFGYDFRLVTRAGGHVGRERFAFARLVLGQEAVRVGRRMHTLLPLFP
jgi:hypothetical protein